jgi:hypothetical protein
MKTKKDKSLAASVPPGSGSTVRESLSREDFETLLLALGIATGTCFRDGNDKLGYRIILLTNTINQNNPDWTPYDVPADERTTHPNPADSPNSNADEVYQRGLDIIHTKEPL